MEIDSKLGDWEEVLTIKSRAGPNTSKNPTTSKLTLKKFRFEPKTLPPNRGVMDALNHRSDWETLLFKRFSFI